MRLVNEGEVCIIQIVVTGRGPVWLGRYNGVVEADGSNPSAPTDDWKMLGFIAPGNRSGVFFLA